MERVIPGPGQESVWDYPRPPRLEVTSKRVRILHDGIVVVDSVNAMRVLETSHPPGIYVPPSDVRLDLLSRTSRSTMCEWKGAATYWTLDTRTSRLEDVAWSYERPVRAFAGLRSHLSFYPGRLDACWLGDERVDPQEGGFYGGWITPDVVGPFKGGPGTWGW
ncbi:MAG: DUF427 domain-containing protein [Acidimicrobiia bacterium]|jgi:uncharacterized protein (DUF427 family)|nr:MAG: DUF427 domain-containing protein [Acidimicrobiia bacterium]